MNYQTEITLNTKSGIELTWWIENLRLCNGQNFSNLNPQVIFQTDASLTGWGAVCNGVQTSGQWSEEEKSLHKCTGTTSNKTGSIFLHQREKGESNRLSDRQQWSLVLPFENGGNIEQKYDQIEQRDLVLSSK